VKPREVRSSSPVRPRMGWAFSPEGGLAGRLFEGFPADPLHLARIQAGVDGGILARGPADVSPAVVEDDDEERHAAPVLAGLPNGAQLGRGRS
jgi:hypothetical protein